MHVVFRHIIRTALCYKVFSVLIANCRRIVQKESIGKNRGWTCANDSVISYLSNSCDSCCHLGNFYRAMLAQSAVMRQ